MKQIRAVTITVITLATINATQPALAGMSQAEADSIVDFQMKLATPPSPTPHSSYEPSTSSPCTFNCPTYYYKPDGDRGIQYQTPLE